MTAGTEDAEALMALTLARALAKATAEAAGAPTRLVSIACDLVDAPKTDEPQSAHTHIERATRSLVFADAEITGDGGRRLMTATGVYRILRSA